jgi:hypothetical protein
MRPTPTPPLSRIWPAIGLLASSAAAQSVHTFPDSTEPLHRQVVAAERVIRGNHWNEGTILDHVIFPPAGLDRPVVGPQADCLDATSELLVAYTHKYAITRDPADRRRADSIFDGIRKLERVTGIPGLFARSLNRTDTALWHEKTLWYPEWHASTAMPGYRWLGDLSTDKFTSIVSSVSMYWEYCADEPHRKAAADLLDRFVGRVVDDNFKLTDLDGKMTLWGNMCPDLPHQPLNSLLMLMGVKAAHRLTGKARYEEAYRRLIDTHRYADHQILSKLLFPEEWRNVGDDYHAARALHILLRYEEDPSLRNKYRMNLNRHWHDWKSMDLSWESSPWFVMVYRVLTGEDVVTPYHLRHFRSFKGFERRRRTFDIPGPNGTTPVESDIEEASAARVRNYWFGRYHGLIDPTW